MSAETAQLAKAVLPWVLSATTLTVMWLAGNKNPAAWLVGFFSQAGWITFACVSEAWGLLPMSIALSFVYARNLHKWRARGMSAETRRETQ